MLLTSNKNNMLLTIELCANKDIDSDIQNIKITKELCIAKDKSTQKGFCYKKNKQKKTKEIIICDMIKNSVCEYLKKNHPNEKYTAKSCRTFFRLYITRTRTMTVFM